MVRPFKVAVQPDGDDQHEARNDQGSPPQDSLVVKTQQRRRGATRSERQPWRGPHRHQHLEHRLQLHYDDGCVKVRSDSKKPLEVYTGQHNVFIVQKASETGYQVRAGCTTLRRKNCLRLQLRSIIG